MDGYKDHRRPMLADDELAAWWREDAERHNRMRLFDILIENRILVLTHWISSRILSTVESEI